MSDEPKDGQVPALEGSPGPSGSSAQTDVTLPAPDSAATADRDRPAGVREDPGPATELLAVVEAVLLVADEPVPAVLLAHVVERPTAEVERALQGLADAYAARGSGIDVRLVAGGWRLYTRSSAAPWVERFVRDGQQARLTQAALETLAVIAYRQPVTRARVSAVRGVNVDGVVRSLLARGLLAEAGVDQETGGALYVTTPLFLRKLGLRTLEQLPSLAPLLPELGDLDMGSMST